MHRKERDLKAALYSGSFGMDPDPPWTVSLVQDLCIAFLVAHLGYSLWHSECMSFDEIGFWCTCFDSAESFIGMSSDDHLSH